jgi:putative transposase
MIIRNYKHLSIVAQCDLLGLCRSTFYYRKKGPSESDLLLARRIDELHLTYPFAGSRMLRGMLRLEGYPVGRKRVTGLMRKMGINAIYRRPNTSRKHPAHKVYPYLLRDLDITCSNQVWAGDITYIPMEKGFLYLFVVMDWVSRKVLSWRLSNTMTTDFCVEAMQEALDRYGRPEIFNSDQGSQFTSNEFTQLLKSNNIAISMNDQGSWRNNVFVERLWKSVKYEEVYLHAYDSVAAARRGLAKYFEFYNRKRPHQSLLGITPDSAYIDLLPQFKTAA